MSKVSYTKSRLRQINADEKRVFGENEDAARMQNPNKKSVPLLLEHQPQIKDVRKWKQSAWSLGVINSPQTR
ncbi:hypothetical protein ACTXT7_014125, partial [Hymenolepis weldensis]